MCQYICACHRIEARVVFYHIRLCLISVFVKGNALRVSVRFIFRIEQVVNGSSYGNSFCVTGLKRIRRTEMVDKVGIERVFLCAEVVEILAADILRLERNFQSVAAESNQAVSDKRR